MHSQKKGLQNLKQFVLKLSEEAVFWIFGLKLKTLKVVFAEQCDTSIWAAGV